MKHSNKEITIKASQRIPWNECSIQIIFTSGVLTRTFTRRVSSHKGYIRFAESCHKKMWKEGFCLWTQKPLSDIIRTGPRSQSGSARPGVSIARNVSLQENDTIPWRFTTSTDAPKTITPRTLSSYALSVTYDYSKQDEPWTVGQRHIRQSCSNHKPDPDISISPPHPRPYKSIYILIFFFL